MTDTGPSRLSANASTTTASNNYAKPWIGTFQLLNDSGQPVTLPERLQRQRHPERRGRDLDRREHDAAPAARGGDHDGLRHRDPLFDATDFTPGGGDTGTC